MNNMRFRLIIGVLVGCVVMFYPSSAYAGVAISLTGGNWDITQSGTVTLPAEGVVSTDPDKWEVTGSPDGYEDILIKVADTHATDAWTAGSTSDVTTYVLRKDSASGIPIIIATDEPLYSKMVGPHSFGLWFKAPAAGAVGGEHILTMTLTADSWFPCPGVCSTALDGTGCVDRTEEGDLPACQKCESGVLVDYQSDAKDTSGTNTCTGDCTVCDDSGNCGQYLWHVVGGTVTTGRSTTTYNKCRGWWEVGTVGCYSNDWMDGMCTPQDSSSGLMAICTQGSTFMWKRTCTWYPE